MLVELLMIPGECRPLCALQADAAFGHRRTLHGFVAVAKRQPAFTLRCDIAPPNPWRHTGKTRQLQYAVGGAAAVAAHDGDSVLAHTEPEGVCAGDETHEGHVELF